MNKSFHIKTYTNGRGFTAMPVIKRSQGEVTTTEFYIEDELVLTVVGTVEVDGNKRFNITQFTNGKANKYDRVTRR